MKTIGKMIVVVLSSVPAMTAHAGSLTIPNTFTSGTPAVAADVNANFTAVKTGVDDHDARIAALEATIAALQATIISQANSIAALQTKLASVSIVTLHGHPTVRFSGVNVQVVNGQGATCCMPNGTGNLVVGYDETDTSGAYHCTVGTVSEGSAACSAAGGVWTNSGFKSGSHYIVAGTENNYSRAGGVVFGFRNTSNNLFANVTGGEGNTASGQYASVSGGLNNFAGGSASNASGGINNTASGDGASVSGGFGSTASGSTSSVSGGHSNTASGQSSSVSGGNAHSASITYSWAAGTYSSTQ